jgi:hypothetical protein
MLFFKKIKGKKVRLLRNGDITALFTKTMKKQFFILFTVILSGNIYGQRNPWYERSFNSYVNYISNKFGIVCYMPKNFNDSGKYYQMMRIREDKTAGSCYGPILQSIDTECIVMYHAQPRYISKKSLENAKKMVMLNRMLNKDTSTVEPKVGTNRSYPRGQITGELKTAIGGFDYYGKPLHDSISFDFNDYVTIVAGKKARNMFNADTVYFYNIPLQKPYQEKYTWCTGMVLGKQGRATMLFKWFFTPIGKRKEGQYIEMLSKQVWYDEDFIMPE